MTKITHQIPTASRFNYAVLKYANKRGVEFHRSEVMEAMADHFNLSTEARRKLTEGKNDLCYKIRTTRALSTFTCYGGLLRRTRRGYYKITDVGRKELKRTSGETITLHHVQNNYRHISE